MILVIKVTVHDICRCESKRCQFQNKQDHINNTSSTTTNKLYKFDV